MNVSCGNCPAKYAVPDDKVRGRKVRIQCKRCGAPIIVDGTTAGASSIPAAKPDAAAIAASRAAAKRTMIGLPPPAVLPEAPVASPPVAPVAPIEPLPPPPQAQPLARVRGPRTATMVGVPPPAFLDAKSNRAQRQPEPKPAPAPAPVLPEWTVALSETDRREMNTAEIVALYIAGTVTQDTFIWKEGMRDWQTPWEIEAIAHALRLKGLRQPQLSHAGASQNPAAFSAPPSRAPSRAPAPSEEATVVHATDRLLQMASEGDEGFGEDEEVTVIASAGQQLAREAMFARRVNEPLVTTKSATSRGANYDDVTVTLATERSNELLRKASEAGADDEVTVAFGASPLGDLRPLGSPAARRQSSRPPPASLPPPAAIPPSSRPPSSRRPPTSDLPPFAAALVNPSPAYEAPSSDEPKPVGARNESSVLFTLDALVQDRKPPPEPIAPAAFDFGPPAPPSAALLPLDLDAATSAPPPAPVAPPVQAMPALAAPDYTAPSRAPGGAEPKRRGLLWLIVLIVLIAAGGASYYFRQPPILYDRYLPMLLEKIGVRSAPAPAPTSVTEIATPAAKRTEPAPAPTAAEPTAAAVADDAGTAPAAEAGAAPAVTAKFDSQVASDKMQETAGLAAKCKQAGQRGGTGRVSVLFGNEGKVLRVDVDGTLAQTPFADCVKQTYGALIVPPFAGTPATMSRGLRIE